MDERSIGLFDSGLGGLTVMREIARRLPRENLIYLGDTARLPYGNKSPEAVLRFSLENSHFLLENQIKLLIVACHTASAVALSHLQRSLPIPVIGVVDAAIHQLIDTTKSKEVAILGTRSTIASNVHKLRIQTLQPNLTVHTIACPLLVPLVEEGWIDHPVTETVLRHYLEPLSHHPIDAALLACTHYPLLLDPLHRLFGPTINWVEPAKACAEEVANWLDREDRLNGQRQAPAYQFYSTDAPDAFRTLASRFFGAEIKEVKLKLLCS